jgi:hypothetical protein
MNKAQQKLIYVASAIVTFMVLYPPFVSNYKPGVSMGQGFRWIWNTYNDTVNIPQLGIQILVAVIITAALFFAFKDKE